VQAALTLCETVGPKQFQTSSLLAIKCLKQNFGYFKDLMPHMVYDVS